MPRVLIKQECLGDILFLQKMGRLFIKHDFDVYWPTKYSWLPEYIVHPKLHWYPAATDITLDIANSVEENHPTDLMTCKYKTVKRTHPNLPDELINMDYDAWQDSILITRNKEKEGKLYEYLCHGEYILINRMFGMEQICTKTYQIENPNIKIINLQKINGFTLIDWCKIIEGAKELHFVDSALIYLIEILNTTDKLYCYNRHLDHAEKCLKPILRKSYIWN